MAKKAISIKLEVAGENKFARESWYGLGPFTAQLNDDQSLALGIPNSDVQICTPAQNDYGTYYMFNIGGGKGFASVVDHEKYGKYLRLRLGDKVELPASVVEKMNFKPGKAAGSKKPAAATNTGFWS
jgi:hypothetical protein